MQKLGRNDPCHCGSGKKFKRCHALKTEADRQSRFLLLVVGYLLWLSLSNGLLDHRSLLALVATQPGSGRSHRGTDRALPPF